MIFDALNLFGEAVSVAHAAGTGLLLGDVIDLGANHRDIGNGQALWWITKVQTEIITAGSAGTIDFKLCSDSTADLATSPTTHLDTGNFTTGAAASNPLLAANKTLACIALPLEGNVYERYLGILYAVGTTTTSAGAVTSFLSLDPHGAPTYPQGVV